MRQIRMKYRALLAAFAVALVMLPASAMAQDKNAAKCLKKIDRAQLKALLDSLKSDVPPELDTVALGTDKKCQGFEPATSLGYTGCRGIPASACEAADTKTSFEDYLNCTGCASSPARLIPTPCGNGIVEEALGESCDPPGSIGGCPNCQICLADCTCNALPAAATCPQNTQGGPNLVGVTVIPGADLDTGWVGVGHDQSVVIGAQTFACLDNCGMTDDPECTGTGATGPNTLNGEAFGPPLPLVAADVATCVVNEFREEGGNPAIQFRNINIQTGETDLAVTIKSIVFLTGNKQRPCPTCSGRSIGAPGKCSGGVRAGQACTTEGTTEEFGNTSSDCLPPGADNAGELEITLDPVTTATATLPATVPCTGGLCPCPGQSKVNNCNGGVSACQISPNCPNPNQPCCQTGDGLNGCFTGDVARTGTPRAPVDENGLPWGQGGYPKLADGGKVASTFCIPATNSNNINTPVGLPGPGAFILPGNACIDFLTP